MSPNLDQLRQRRRIVIGPDSGRRREVEPPDESAQVAESAVAVTLSRLRGLRTRRFHPIWAIKGLLMFSFLAPFVLAVMVALAQLPLLGIPLGLVIAVSVIYGLRSHRFSDDFSASWCALAVLDGFVAYFIFAELLNPHSCGCG